MYDGDPSFDLWGGGGLVSSMTDVAGFYRALFEGRVYDRRETLGRMIETAIVSEGAQIGMGIAGRVFDGHTIYGHGGYWGLYAGFIPDVDAALAVSVQDHAALPALAMELLPALITTIAPGAPGGCGSWRKEGSAQPTQPEDTSVLKLARSGGAAEPTPA